MRPCPKKRAALPLDAGKTIAMLVRAIWQIVGSRKELARLADLDDRMLADIGLTRSDLHVARFAPFWQDPTSILKRRVKRRWGASVSLNRGLKMMGGVR